VAYDATKMKDWQIAEAAEANMPTPEVWQERLKPTQGRDSSLRENRQARFHEDY